MTTYYAIRYAYGRDTINDGDRRDQIFAFPTRKGRNAFVDACPNNSWVNNMGYTEAIPASDHRVRKAQAHGTIEHPVRTATTWDDEGYFTETLIDY